MKKALIALAAAAAIAVSSIAVSTDANAKHRRWVAPAIVGGVLLGAGIAGAYAYPRVYYPVPGYEPYPVYYAAPPYACPGGYWARRPIRDRYGNVVGWSKPRWFCPY